MTHKHVVHGMTFTITLGQWGIDNGQACVALAAACRALDALPYAELVKLHMHFTQAIDLLQSDCAASIEETARRAAFDGVSTPPEDVSHLILLGALP